MNRLYKFERRHPGFGIPNLMVYIAGAMLFVYIFDSVSQASLSGLLYFDAALILQQRQFWRVLTFIFLPLNTSPIFIIFTLYFYYMIGSALEREWGCCIFTIYYAIGIAGSIAAGFITGTAQNTYLNLSLFFAFAIMFPNHQVLLFFILPVKIKYMAYFNALFFAVSFILGNWPARAAITASLANLIIFFGGTLIKTIKREMQYRETRNNFRRQLRRK